MKNLKTFYKEVGKRIGSARKLRTPRLTQQALGERVSLTRTSITNLEKGRQKILVHTLVDIAKALKVDVSSLLPLQSNTDQESRLTAALKNHSAPESEWVRDTIAIVADERDS